MVASSLKPVYDAYTASVDSGGSTAVQPYSILSVPNASIICTCVYIQLWSAQCAVLVELRVWARACRAHATKVPPDPELVSRD